MTSFAVILGLLGASMALTKKPSDYKLEWLNSGKVMKITFPDKTTDEITLKADKDSNCFFHGYLKSDLESEVEVDGCKGNVEVVEIDSRLVRCGLVFLLLEADGKTYEIDPTEGFQLNKTDTVVPPESLGPSPAAMQGGMPTSVVLKLHLRYDPSILEMVGGSHLAAKRKIKAIVDLSRPWFKRTRNLAMDIEIKIMSIEAYQSRIPEREDGAIQSLKGRGSSGSGHITAFFRTANQWVYWGVAYLGTICRHTTHNVQVNAIMTGNDVQLDAVNAMLFAHELGHNLGME